MKKWVSLSLIAFILITSLSVAYYFVVFRPNKDMFETRQVLSAQKKRIGEREKCLEKTLDDRAESWRSNCELVGKGNNCDLPIEIADSIVETTKYRREECFNRFPND